MRSDARSARLWAPRDRRPSSRARARTSRLPPRPPRSRSPRPPSRSTPATSGSRSRRAKSREPFDVESLAPIEQAPQAPEPGEPAGAPGYDEDPWLEEERDEVPADEALDRPREPGEEQGEDVLEDTPDFLQETPEHDRLWFEQKPPRDFDWDK